MRTTPTNPPLVPPAKMGVAPGIPANLLYGQFAAGGLGKTRLSQTKVRRVWSSAFVREMCRALRLVWSALAIRARRAPKALVVNETAALGDRRFIAVVQFERQRFLIGSSPSSVTLLAPLPDAVPADATATAARMATSTDSSQGVGE